MANTGRIRYREVDQNPASPTFGQERWGDYVVDETACPPPQLYDSQAVAGYTTKSDCPFGVPSSVYYAVPAGYARAATQAAADAQALAYYENTRQAHANQFGYCDGQNGRSVLLTEWSVLSTDGVRVTLTRSDTNGPLQVSLLVFGPDGEAGGGALVQATLPNGQAALTTDLLLPYQVDPISQVAISATQPTDYRF